MQRSASSFLSLSCHFSSCYQYLDPPLSPGGASGDKDHSFCLSCFKTPSDPKAVTLWLMPLSTTDMKPANKIFRSVGMEVVSQPWQPPRPPATSHWCSTLSPSPRPCWEEKSPPGAPWYLGDHGSPQLCLCSSQSTSQSEPTNEFLCAHSPSMRLSHAPQTRVGRPQPGQLL